jgi:TldD protein
MRLTRRSFLLGTSAALLATPRLVTARGLLTDPTLDDVVKRALAAASKAGATYADIRIVRHRRESIGTREDRVEYIGGSEEYGLGVRVIQGGAWGFAATPNVTAAEAERPVNPFVFMLIPPYLWF